MSTGDVLVCGAPITSGVKFKVPYKPGPYLLIHHNKERSTSSKTEVAVAEIKMLISGYITVMWNIYKDHYADSSYVFAHIYKNSNKEMTLSISSINYGYELCTSYPIAVVPGDSLILKLQGSATMACYNDMFEIRADGTPDYAEIARYATIVY